MVPIGSVATFQDKTGPYRVVRYNLFPAVEVDGDTAPGYSSGQSLDTMEQLAKHPAGRLRRRMDRHRLSAEGRRQHRGLVFALAVVFVFLVLAAQYESLTCRWRSS
jgi:multidrug efflux pump subunit AcrB